MSESAAEILAELRRQKEKDRERSAAVAALPFVLSALIVGPILSGWVTVHFWRWFVMPLFNLPDLRIAQAIGLTIMVRVLIGHRQAATDKKKTAVDHIAEAFGSLILSPLFVFALGWLIHLFL